MIARIPAGLLDAATALALLIQNASSEITQQKDVLYSSSISQM